MKITALIVTRDLEDWDWQKKVQQIKEFYEDTPFDFEIDLCHVVQFEDVPFSVYKYSHSGTGVVKAKRGVDKQWYDENILRLAKGYDIVCFVLDRDYWIKNSGSSTLRGWHTGDDPGPIHETQVAAYEHNKVVKSKSGDRYYYKGVSRHHSSKQETMNQFVYTCVHEFNHALSSILGVKDKLHEYVRKGKFHNYALLYLAIPVHQTTVVDLLTRYITYLKNKLMKPKIHSPIADFDTSRVSQYFGANARLYSTYYGLKGHNGVDVRGNVGEDIYAVKGGEVVSVQWSTTGFGRHLKIVSGDEEWTYAHNHNMFVQVGDKVELGDRIATLGNTGHSTGPHLHIGLRKVSVGKGWSYPGSSTKISVKNYGNGYRGAVDPWDQLEELV